MEMQKNIPELRFPEFYGEWEKPKLSDKMEIFRGASPRPRSDPRYYGGIIPRLMIEDATRDGKYAYPKIDFLTEEGAKKSRLLKKGSFVLSCSGTMVGIPTILGVDACIHDGWLGFKNFKDVVQEFLYYIFLRMYERMQGKATTGGVFNNLTTSIIRDLRIGFPSFAEQQKIASFFTTIDQKIFQLKQKKTLLELYKKGVMQKIFSQELRFRDENGREFPNWKNYKFKQIYNFKVTNSFSRENLNYESGIVKNIHYGDIHTKFETLFDITNEEVPYINSEISIDRINDDNYCKKGDIVFADASEDVSDVGKSIELVNLNGEKVLAGLHTILARPVNSKVASGFGGYLMKSEDVRKQIMKISQGSKITSISSSRLCDIDLFIPCPDEQVKIAKFLSAIDIKINHIQTQIEKAELWKKGLLQKMFV